ncbi:unnamed protein product [Prunus brigantina]
MMCQKMDRRQTFQRQVQHKEQNLISRIYFHFCSLYSFFFLFWDNDRQLVQDRYKCTCSSSMAATK